MSSLTGISPPSGQFSTTSPSHGGSTDPNEVRRRTQHTQNIPSQPSTHSTHGGNTDPNEVRHYASSQSSSPPPTHGGNVDPNEIRQRLAQSQSASPLLRDQAGTYTTTRVVSSQESTAQYLTPSPSPYGDNMNSSARPLHSTPFDQTSGQAQSGYFQGSQTAQPLGGPQVQYRQTVAAVTPPPGQHGSPPSQLSSQPFPPQTHGSNQQYGGQPSHVPQVLPPQVRTQSPPLSRARS